jgi:carboxymethylenebutenolidase
VTQKTKRVQSKFLRFQEDCRSNEDGNDQAVCAAGRVNRRCRIAGRRGQQNTALPVVVLIHEWWGINDHIRDVASRYAQEDFVHRARSFRGKTARDPQEAARLMQSLAIEDGVGTIKTAIDEAKRRYNTSKCGITGFCMGGTFALRAACDLSDDLAASIPLRRRTRRKRACEVESADAFHRGQARQLDYAGKVAALEESARKHHLPVEARSYDADHAFFNDTRPEVYDAEAAQDAWRRALDFFREHLQSKRHGD